MPLWSLPPQRRMAEVLESREAHYMVIGLVLLDLAIVLAELVLSSFYPTPELAPHLGVSAAAPGWLSGMENDWDVFQSCRMH